MNLNDFINDWNEKHKRFTFSAHEIPVQGRPDSVEVRYSAARYQYFLSKQAWQRLKDCITTKSHGTMYVSTNEELFERGILEIKIASSNHNYQERFVIGTLVWIAEEFFPKEE